ncbi:beta-lactamase family protein [Saccharopolyspora erythraea]|uniref:serine hydrolase domain-containing protein n=1 Tax=Saccharopolyspora erythraea TaxID=1836 RepID=UPI001BAB8869|nr:serine hydrolase domain-containing protein [Saccharopolyspora erythraea]QUH05005.1 beta-lactamase family protein [Saccharopolyspora erythraea]
MLNHTSGINDYDHVLFPSYLQGKLDDLEAKRWKTWRPEELIAIGLAEPPTGAPGERLQYANTNYLIAGELLEKVTGQDGQRYITRHVIRPLGLRNTYFPGSFPFMVGPHSEAYEAVFHLAPRWGEYSDYNMTWAGTAGALVSTPQDLNTFFGELLGGRLLPPELLSEMKRTVPVRDGAGNEAARYGLGLLAVDGGECGSGATTAPCSA